MRPLAAAEEGVTAAVKEEGEAATEVKQRPGLLREKLAVFRYDMGISERNQKEGCLIERSA
jgi:hypothetical protein